MKIPIAHGLFLLFLSCPLLWGDIIELRNGDLLSGTILSMDSEQVRISTEYGTLTIRRDLILRGEFGEEGDAPEAVELEDLDPSIHEKLIYQLPFEENYRNLKTHLTPMEAHGLRSASAGGTATLNGSHPRLRGLLEMLPVILRSVPSK